MPSVARKPPKTRCSQTLPMFDLPAMEAGIAAGSAGIGRAAAANEARNPGWVPMAVAALMNFVAKRQSSEHFTIEAARLALAPALPEPTDGRVWGAVTRSALAQGVIEYADEFAKAASSNGSYKPAYRRGSMA